MLKLFSFGSAVVGLSLATLWAPMVEAQEANMQQLRDCAAIENPLQRLVCYDKAVAGEAPRQRATQAPTAAKKQNNYDPEAQFGLAKKESTDEVIFVALSHVEKDRYGKATLHLTNGQIWKQLDSTSMQLPLDATYLIEKGALNSYYFGRDGYNQRINVKRVE